MTTIAASQMASDGWEIVDIPAPPYDSISSARSALAGVVHGERRWTCA